jgi:hypothetical protein
MCAHNGREWGEVTDGTAGGQTARAGGVAPFLQVWFRCANAYLRVSRSRDGKRYLARCPRCGQAVRFVVGEGGTDRRQFMVDCGR